MLDWNRYPDYESTAAKTTPSTRGARNVSASRPSEQKQANQDREPHPAQQTHGESGRVLQVQPTPQHHPQGNDLLRPQAQARVDAEHQISPQTSLQRTLRPAHPEASSLRIPPHSHQTSSTTKRTKPVTSPLNRHLLTLVPNCPHSQHHTPSRSAPSPQPTCSRRSSRPGCTATTISAITCLHQPRPT